MGLTVRWLVAVALVFLSAPVWAQIHYFTLIDTDNSTATGCTVTLPNAGTVTGIERRLTATISETATPQVISLTLESCVGGSFGAPVSLPGTPYPVGLNNGVGGADVIEQAAPADAIAPPGPPVRLYFAAQGSTSDDLLGASGGSPILFGLRPTGESVGIPTLSEWGLLGLILILLVAVIRQRSHLPASMVGILLVGMVMAGIVWAAGFLLDGQINDWQGVPAAGTDAGGDSTSNTTDILAAFAAREGANAFFRIDVADAQTPNHAPSFTKGADQMVLEDAGAQTVNGWATAIDDGDPGSVQNLTFQVTNNTNPSLFSAGPAVAANGTLTYTPADNANGSATITLVLKDDGGTANGGVDTSPAQTFVITVTPVNDAPSFTKGPDQTVLENAGAQTVNPWATGISAGPTDEAGQTLTFNLTGNTNPSLFSAGPAISPTGVLTYTPAANASGSATITVTLSDNGSNTPPNINTSTPQSFAITVTAVDDPPTAVDDPATVTEDAPATAIDVLANDTDPDGGPISIASVTQPANGTVVITGGGTGLTYQPNPNYCNAPPGTTLDTFTYALTPGGSSATVTVTVTCVDDPPAAVDDPAMVDEDSGVNTIDVLANDTDPDAGPKLVNSVTQPTSGTVAITNGGADLTYQPNANYCNNPSGTTLDTFTYTLTPGSSTATVSVTVNCLNDAPVIALPGPIVAYDTVSPVILDATATVIDIDSPNFDTGVLTANVTTNCENNDRLSVRNEGTDPDQIGVSGANVTFNPGAGAVTIGTISTEFDCGTATSTLSIALNANADLTATQALLRNLTYFSASTPTGTSRVVEVVLTDGDGGTSNTATKTVNIDAAPEVQNINPANNATGVPINANVLITFSETVNAPAAAFAISCATSGNHPFALGGGPASFTLDPATDFANGEVCTVTVTATQITDQDSNDPPDNMTADFTATFTTVDTAPTVLASSTPANAAVVATTQTVTLNFSEAVNVVPANIALTCNSNPVTFNSSATSNVTAVTLTPTAPLPEGTSCTLAVPTNAATDEDSVDPPDELDAAFNRTFTVDAAPTFVSSNPANGNVNVNVGSNIGVGFSEAVNVTGSSFTLDCGGGPLTYTLSGSGTNFIILDPSANLPGGTSCTVTINGGSVSDTDTADPPDAMTTSPSFSFTTQSFAEDDAYNVTPHLTLAVDTGVQSGRVTANDQLGPGTIIGFGFGACTGTAPGAQLDAGTANGRLTLNANGSFSYEPPAGVSNTTKTFCYTVSGGDTANIVFTLQNTELVWFVDVAAGAGGVGNQARPFQTLAAAVGVDTAGDTIFIEHNAASYTCGISLLPNEKLIGEGSGGTLAAHSGVTPVAGSSFPTLTNNSAQWPTLTAGADCVALSTGNTIRGFNFGDVGAANTAIVGSGFVTLTVNDAAIATNGQALNLINGTLNATFGSVSSSGGLNNVRLVTIAGTVDLGGSGALTGAGSGVAFVVNGGTGAITYGGSITAGVLVDIQSHGTGSITLSGALSSTSGNPGINIANNTSGTIALSNASKVVTSGANPAVMLTNNTGATINFTGGGLAISTTGGTGFSATGGGTVNVTGGGNTITTTTGTALNVANTNIGASGLTFQSISANGAANGIVLNSTGASGGLTVTGNSAGLCGGSVSSGPPASAATTTAPVTADCTGGTIQSTTGPGIVLTSTSNVSLTRIRVINSGDDGIQGTNVTGFTLASSLLDGNGNALNENSIDFGDTSSITPNGLHGTGSITNSTIRNAYHRNVAIRNLDGAALTAFSITGSQFRQNPSNGDADDNILMEALGTANMALSVTGSHFSSTEGDHIQTAGVNSGTLNVNITNNTFTGGHSTPLGQGITISAATGVPGWNGRIDYDVNGNHITGSVTTAVHANLGTSSAAAVFDGFVRNNVIGSSGVSLSCSTQAHGVYIEARGNGTHNSAVTGNTIRQCFDRGIFSEAGDGDSVLNLTVQSNTIDQQVDAAAREAIQTNHGITSTNVFGNVDTNNVCLELGGAGALANVFSHGGGAPDDFRLRKRQEATVRLPGYAGGIDQTAGSLAQVVSFIQGQNTGSAGEPGSASASGAGGGYTGGAACTLPSP
ncbi:MAG: Ig-like domain-containing protein [Candidatus Competibacter sp.]|jgi:methionine-rich copper-binding protein CopC